MNLALATIIRYLAGKLYFGGAILLMLQRSVAQVPDSDGAITKSSHQALVGCGQHPGETEAVTTLGPAPCMHAAHLHGCGVARHRTLQIPCHSKGMSFTWVLANTCSASGLSTYSTNLPSEKATVSRSFSSAAGASCH